MASTQTGTDQAHGAAEAGHASAAGMPQLEFSTFPNQVFWLLVTLAVIYFILSRVALPRIAAVLSERQGTITHDLAAAEELKRKAEDAREAHDKALADARAEAHRIVEGAKAAMQADLDDATARADAEIAARVAESERAIAGIRAGAVENAGLVAREVTQEIIFALTGHPADGRTVSAAVNARMKG